MTLLLYRWDADEHPQPVKVGDNASAAQVARLKAQYEERGFDVVTVATADEAKYFETR